MPKANSLTSAYYEARLPHYVICGWLATSSHRLLWMVALEHLAVVSCKLMNRTHIITINKCLRLRISKWSINKNVNKDVFIACRVQNFKDNLVDLYASRN